MHSFPENYYSKLRDAMNSIVVTDKEGKAVGFYKGIEEVMSIVTQLEDEHKIMLIGNGASAAISSHIALDFWKNAGIKALAFNDSSLLTSISNDYGYEHVFEKPIDMFANQEDVLMAVSSSGQSENILRGAFAARKKGLRIITFSGFDEDNPLRKLGDVNFYVPAAQYGYVEVVHLSICHCLVDMVIEVKDG